MTLSQKIQKAFQRETYASLFDGGKKRSAGDIAHSLWRQFRQINMHRRAKRLTLENILAGIDPAELARIQKLSEQENDNDVFWTKYLDVNKWLTLNIRYAKELGLVEKPARNVLDLGCGGGFFLVVCRILGSRVIGLDLDKDKVLNEMIALFRLKRVPCRIRAFVKLPDLGRRFDLITAFMICFNFPPRHPYWGVRQWDYFLNDLMNSHLAYDGRLLLSLNKQPDGKEYDDTLRRYFESREGVVEGKRIIFTTAGLRRTYSPAILAAAPPKDQPAEPVMA